MPEVRKPPVLTTGPWTVAPNPDPLNGSGS